MWVVLMNFVLRSTGKVTGEREINWGRKTFLELDYADDLSILDEIMSKLNEIEVLKIQGARMGSKIRAAVVASNLVMDDNVHY